MMKRVLGAAGVGVLVSCVGALAACGSSSEEDTTKSGAAALTSANVGIELHDANGNKIGEGAGVLIAPNLVLTSAHLVAGKAKWTVTTADGKKTVNGTRGLTYDWMKYDSLKSHPRKHDVAVIYLDKPIQLASYPTLATTKQTSGTEAQRVRHLGGNFDLVASKLGTVRTFPHAYTASMPTSETVNTGGAVINSKGEIVGIVTGRGMQTAKLYIARVDGLAKWLSPKVVCAGGKTGGLSVRTYGAPPPKPGCDAGPGGSSGSSGTSGASSSGSSGASSSGSSGASSSGSSGASSGGASSGSSGDGTSSGGGGGGGSCDDGGGNCSGDCDGSGGGGGGGGGDDGSSGSSGSSGASSGSNTSGGPGTTSGGTSGSSGSSSGSSGDDGSSGNSSGNPGTTSGGSTELPPPGGGGGGGGGGGDEEVCEGPTDNPTECPPELTGCEGSNCGGGAPDNTIDYGNCACTSSVGTGSLPIIR